MLQIFTNAKYDFISKRHWAYAISLIVTLAGLGHIAWQGGLKYGIDFSGGTLIQVRFQQPTTVDAVRSALDRVRMSLFGHSAKFCLDSSFTARYCFSAR